MSPTTPPKKRKPNKLKKPALLVNLTILNKFFPLYGHKISNVSKFFIKCYSLPFYENKFLIAQYDAYMCLFEVYQM